MPSPRDSVSGRSEWHDRMPLATFAGDGYEFRYPADAALEIGSSHPGALTGTVVRGPTMRLTAVHPGNVDAVTRDGPAYELLVTSTRVIRGDPFYPIDSAARAFNAACAPDCVIGEISIDTLSIAHERAYLVQQPGGDCSSYEIYFVRGRQRVAFAYNLSADDHLDALTTPLQWLVVETFRWR